MIIKFDGTKIAADVTWGDLETLESGSHKKSIEILARFMLDDNGNPLTPQKAIEILRALKPREAGNIIGEFYKTLKNNAVNPTSGG